MERAAITLPVEAIKAVNVFLLSREAKTPTDIRDQLIDMVGNGSPVQDAVNMAELIYARREELSPELVAIGADIAAMLANYNFHDMRSSGRGMALASAMRAMPGVPELVTPVEAEEAPEPLTQFVAPDASTEPPAPAA